MKRGEVISAIQNASKDEDTFMAIFKKHMARNDPFNLVEFFQALPRKHNIQVWTSVLALTQECVMKLDANEQKLSKSKHDSDGSQVLTNTVLNVLNGVVLLIQSALNVNEPLTPTPLGETLQLLHDILLGPLNIDPDLQNAVSLLCEGWWCAERGERDGLVPHTLLYLVARSHTEEATGSDVKRVWSMRQAFLLLDFEDSSVEPFKAMLLSATFQPLYLNIDEGCKFLSFLFVMHPKFVEDLHQTIKNQLPYASKSLLVTYGDVYFRAWRLSSGSYLKQIEENCLQDLMYCAVHAPRFGQHSLFHSLRKLLDCFHSQNVQRGVSEMLLRLYSPFLWRSLKVANADVRANACTLFLDAFPLHNPDCNREENDKNLQKQFDAMTELLNDSSVLVRVMAVMGVSRVLSFYWEMIPVLTIKTLLGKLVKELVWDSSAIDVRVAVLQGLCIILENRFSHTLMRELLPLLQNVLHDSSEKVRIALLELLLLIKGIRMIKFWHICPLDHLLSRVETDSVHVVKRIVSLLIDSFQPSNTTPCHQIERCIALLRTNPEAARRFYQLAMVNLSPSEVTKFISAILSTIMHCVESDGVTGEGGIVNGDIHSENKISDDEDRHEDSDDSTDLTRGGWTMRHPDSESQLAQQVEEEKDATSSLCLADSDVLCGLLETVVVLWEGVRDRLEKKGSKEIKKKLEGRMAECLPRLFDTFKDGPSRSALYLLSSYLPKDSVMSIVNGTLATLSSLRYPMRSHDYCPLLIALVSWDQTGHVIKLMNQWLEPELCGKRLVNGDRRVVVADSKSKGKRKGGGNKGKANGLLTTPPQPLLAIEFINWMLTHPTCLQDLKKLREFWDLTAVFKMSMSLLEEHYLLSPSSSDDHTPSFDLLSKCLSLYVRLCMHHEAEYLESEESFVGRLEEVLVWCDRVLLPALNDKETYNKSSIPKSRYNTRKRKANQTHPPTLPLTSTHARKVADILLSLFSEVIMLGLVSGEDSEVVEREFACFAANVAKSNLGHLLLPSLSKLLYQLCESSTKSEVDGIHSSNGSLIPISVLLESSLSLLHNLHSFSKVWCQFKQCFSAVIVTSVRVQSLTSVGPQIIPTFTVIVKSALNSLIDHIKLNPSQIHPTSVDELPEFTSCLVKQSCKESQSTCSFLSHLDSYLGENELQPPQLFVMHQASLFIVSAMAGDRRHKGSSADLMMHCLRRTLTIVETWRDNDRTKWSDLLSTLSSLVQSTNDILMYH